MYEYFFGNRKQRKSMFSCMSELRKEILDSISFQSVIHLLVRTRSVFKKEYKGSGGNTSLVHNFNLEEERGFLALRFFSGERSVSARLIAYA
jgi:hypothetical protein